MHDYCHPEESHTNLTLEFREQLANMQSIFIWLQIIFCVIGVLGNVLNLRTLQSPSLQTVPFMYIRSLAVFDTIGLSCILLHFYLAGQTNSFTVMLYIAYVEKPVINTFLVGGLYCAFMLTVERWKLLSQPHFKPSANPRRRASRKIYCALFWAAVLHIPMVVHSKLRTNYNAQTQTVEYTLANNVEMLCREPIWSIYYYYKMFRECLRCLCIVVMTVLNIIIARNLQITKMRRRRLVRRASPSEPSANSDYHSRNCSVDSLAIAKKEFSPFMRSFAEKKLTGLMFAICIIFILGNMPQVVVMVFQNESMDSIFEFQLFRNLANLLEVLNHCLNFYVFCMASREYMRAFLLNSLCLRKPLLSVPAVESFVAGRRTSSYVNDSAVLSCNTSMGMTIKNKDFLSCESISVKAEWAVPLNAQKKEYGNDAAEVPHLKSILVIGDRGDRNRKSLTIANHVALPIDDDDDDDQETVQL